MTDERRKTSFPCDTANRETSYGVYFLKCPVGGDTGKDKASNSNKTTHLETKLHTSKKCCFLAFAQFDPIKSLARGRTCLFVLHNMFFQAVRELRGRPPGHGEVLLIHVEVKNLLSFSFTWA